ncbi:unnamed protein product [Allacma fusca]|uniref:UDP-glycosyltransferase n=1 Tax=Allacma fusca TaxID=39272 RepID=A0A8J2KTR0_9HEXA|nr:unnamed protein product [Allacma fusca]
MKLLHGVGLAVYCFFLVGSVAAKDFGLTILIIVITTIVVLYKKCFAARRKSKVERTEDNAVKKKEPGGKEGDARVDKKGSEGTISGITPRKPVMKQKQEEVEELTWDIVEEHLVIVTLADDPLERLKKEALEQLIDQLDDLLDECWIQGQSYVIMGTKLVDNRVTIVCENAETANFIREKVGTMKWTSPDFPTPRDFKGWEPRHVPSGQTITYAVSIKSKVQLDWEDFKSRLQKLNQVLELNTEQWIWWNKDKLEKEGWTSTGESKFLEIGVDKESARILERCGGTLFYKSVPLQFKEFLDKNRIEVTQEGTEVELEAQDFNNSNSVFCSLITESTPDKILFLLPIAAKSHKNVFEPLINALADKGHKVTVASPIPPTKPYPNVREIIPVTFEVLFQQFPDPFELRRKNKISAMLSISKMLQGCDKAYLSKDLRELQHDHFDLVFLSGYGNDCFLGLVHLIGAPFIMLTTVPVPSLVARNVGDRFPASFVPSPIFSFSDEMDFWERMLNLFVDIAGQGFMLWSSPIMESIYRDNLGETLPGVEEIKGNVSMIFSNSFFALNYPRPLLPDIIEVGGMHCRPAKPLPKDLNYHISGAEHGFIYFSMGSILKTDQMPEEMRKTFLEVFSRMKQLVIWKWNSGHMDNLPSNVKLSKWLPQQDILGHPNIKLFISHGGLLSTQEAAYHGVPVLGIPMFGDQDLNVKQAATHGYAVMLEILDLTEELLEDRLNTILNDPRFTLKAKHLSSIIKDQPQTPLDRAQDILGHSNIKLLIIHGGLLSIQEAAYHGVPMYACNADVWGS